MKYCTNYTSIYIIFLFLLVGQKRHVYGYEINYQYSNKKTTMILKHFNFSHVILFLSLFPFIAPTYYIYHITLFFLTFFINKILE